MRWTAWSTVAACLLVLAPGASAQQAPGHREPATADPANPEVFYPFPRVAVFADLTYVRERDASICPDEALFRLEVGAEMGSLSFERMPRAAYVGRVRVVLSKVPGGFAASYTWEDAQGVSQR